MEPRAYKVSKILEYMRDLLEEDMLLCSLWIEGEISNFVRHSSGHLFFSLKENDEVLKCAVFARDAKELPFEPKNGDLVKLYGRISLYKKAGDVRFVGEFMSLAGVGKVMLDLDKLKAKLLDEGLFDNERTLPKYPQKVAIVTSPTGAVIADMLKVFKARNPLIKIVLVPALVQGEAAPKSIAQAIEIANEKSGADVLIVGRGGGSSEDLAAFNDEIVVRAVHGSKMPVVSAVGHQTDFSLCDLAADLRCATPTEAAQVLSVTRDDMVAQLVGYAEDLQKTVFEAIKNMREKFENAHKRLDEAAQKRVTDARRDLVAKGEILEKISPLAVLKRGFAVVADKDGAEIKLSKNLKSGQEVSLHFSDGVKEATIT